MKEYFAQWYTASKNDKYLTMQEAAEQLSDSDFRTFYIGWIKSRGKMYWDDDCLCDRCHESINTIEELRIMFGRRVHHNCFKLDFAEWLERKEADGYVDPDARTLFKKIRQSFDESQIYD